MNSHDLIKLLSIFPLDIVKTRLQNGGSQYSGVLDAFRKMVASEGIRGLYRGLSPNLIGIIPEKAIKLAVNDYSREFWASRSNTHPDHIPVFYGMISGATAGFCQVVATNPMEIVKIQLQMAGANTRPGEPKISAINVVKSLGLKGLYKGTTATLMRDVPFSFVFFPLVAVLKSLGTPEGKPTPFSVIFGSGIVAGAIASASVTPMDVVKTRLQILPKPGPSALFKGVVPRVLIVSPLFAITVLVYEFQQRFLASSRS